MPTLAPRRSTGSTQTAAAAPRRRRQFPPWTVALAVFAAFLLLAALIVLLAWALPKWPRHPLKKGAPPAPLQVILQPAEPTPTPGLHKTETVPAPPARVHPHARRPTGRHPAARPPVHHRQGHQRPVREAA